MVEAKEAGRSIKNREWTTRRIRELGRVVTGKTPPTKDHENFGGPYPFITIPDLDGRVSIDRTARTLSEKGADKVKSSLLPAGAVLMSCIATVGKCGVTSKPSFTNQQINSVIPGAETDPRFLYYAFTQLAPQLNSAGGGGSVYTNVSKSRFSDIEISLPPLPQQRAIAHILGTLDDKIELNRRMNQTLEDMARALFKSWFVDFDPVRAKTEGRWRRGHALPGMPADLYDLFPDRLVASELGDIPEGWEVSKLGDVANEVRVSAQPQSIRLGTPYIALEHMPKRRLTLSEWDVADGVGSSKFRFKRGDILFGKLRPYFHKVGIAPLEGVCSTDIVVVAPAADHWFGLVLGHISSDEFVDYTDTTSTGTRMPRTKWRDMARYSIPLPTRGLAEAFAVQILPWVNQIVSAIHVSRALASLKDVLIPKLVSGEVRVRPDTTRNRGH